MQSHRKRKKGRRDTDPRLGCRRQESRKACGKVRKEGIVETDDHKYKILESSLPDLEMKASRDETPRSTMASATPETTARCLIELGL